MQGCGTTPYRGWWEVNFIPSDFVNQLVTIGELDCGFRSSGLLSNRRRHDGLSFLAFGMTWFG